MSIRFASNRLNYLRTAAAFLLACISLTLSASHTPDPSSVTVAGNLQDELGCPGDWQPDCAATQLGFDAEDGVWQGTFNIPAGNWEYKAPLNDSWDENYGANAQQNGANIPLNLGSDTDVKFYYDHETHWITDNVSSEIATVPGSFQDELGCSGDWQPWCLQSWLQDPDGDEVFNFTTNRLPAGNYEAKVAHDESWDENYGAGGVTGGANIPFTVPSSCAAMDFEYELSSHILTVSEAAAPTRPASVTIPGSFQEELGCPGDWQPDCAVTHLGFDGEDTIWQGTFNIPAGNWEYKAALNDSWDANYGANAQQNGPNIPLNVGADTDVKFYYDDQTNWVWDSQNKVIATLAGNFQSELGCSGDWQPWCLRSMLQDPDGDGIYTFSTSGLPAGEYEVKVAHDEGWAENYGDGGVPGGANIPFTVPADCTETFFTYDPVTHLLTKGQTDPLTVRTVPWDAADPAIPHDAFNSEVTTLKGTADVQGPNYAYTWDFGDGSPPVTGIVSNKYVIEAQHAYIGVPGDIFTATLTVTNTSTGDTDSEDYFVAIRTKALDAEVNVAIDEGLWYLHKTMLRYEIGGEPLGRWSGPWAGSSYLGNSAANVQAFEVHGHLETGPESNPYTETVARGLAHLLSGLGPYYISLQSNPLGWFDPDVNGNGLGIRVNQSQDMFQGGIVIDALVASGTPEAVAVTGPTNVIGRTFGEIVQDMVDYYSYCQWDYASRGGGWRYSCNSDSSNAVSMWAAIGIIAAERDFGATVPQIVKGWNENWINYSQNALGYFGYTGPSPSPWGPYATTPSGMLQLTMDGFGRGDPRWDKAETFIRNNFCYGVGPRQMRDYYFGLFAFTKSMLLHDINGDGTAEPITMHAQQPGNTNPLDWYAAEASAGDACDGVARTLVNDQLSTGHWWGHNFDSRQNVFETAHAIMMLRSTVSIPPNQPPEANAGDDQTVFAGDDCTATVWLDGGGSTDPDGDPITSYIWTIDSELLYGQVQEVTFGEGLHTASLVVSDGDLESEPDEVIITVVDNSPPVGNLNLTPSSLWPPNGQMALVNAAIDASDNCDAAVVVELEAVTASSGNEADVSGATYGTDDRSFFVRATRPGTMKDGAWYEVTYSLTDSSGNSVRLHGTVTVPHDQRVSTRSAAQQARARK